MSKNSVQMDVEDYLGEPSQPIAPPPPSFTYPSAGYSFYVPHERVILDCGTEEITKQSHKAECDINTILRQYSKTGIINHINATAAQYLDLPDNLDFQQSLALVDSAKDSFASLPSKVRDYYQNSPSLFLAALSDPAERERLTEWGVFRQPPAPEPRPAKPAEGDGSASSARS